MENPKHYSAPALAFLGDAVYELRIRELLVKSGKAKSGELHAAAVERVRASFQAGAAHRIAPLLTEEETDIYKRGRNCNAVHPPRGATATDYRCATGLECLFGYLYLKGDANRIDVLLGEILKEA